MMTEGTAFHKPFGKELLGRECVTHYAYPREQLTAEPIFPYFVFDGGAFNFANDRFGTADGDALLELTMSGKLFDAFTLDGNFQWERSFTYTRDTDFTPKYEWQIWPQRLYMTIPVAQAFLKTGDRRYADRWLEIVRAWDTAHPYQPFDPEIHYLHTDMVWRDMQVAWRTLSLMHGMFLLQDAPFTCEDWAYLYRFLNLHFEHLYVEAQDRLKRNHQQNHVLQIGAALVMAGAMYPEFSHAEEFVKIGSDTVKMNMGAIYPDGGSNEDSPSYSHFIVRLYLETYLLLKNNGLPIIDGLKETITRQYEWLWNCMDPTGHVIRFSDSYAFDSMADLRRAEALTELDFPRERGDVLFPDSHVGILRRGDMMLAADAMNQYGGHRHWGRPQTVLFRGTEPILVESGCSNYDLWDLYLYVRSMEAHNVVFCPDFDNEHSVMTSEIRRFDPEHGVMVTWGRVENGGRAYEWERTLTLTEDRLVIEDTARSEESLSWSANFHLAHHHIKIDSPTSLRQLADHFLLTVETDLPAEVSFVPVLNGENRQDYARLLKCRGTGTEFRLKTVFTFTER